MTPRRLLARFLFMSVLTIPFVLAASPISAQDVTVSDGTPSVVTIEQSNGTFELTIVVPEGWFQDFSDTSDALYAGNTEAAIDKSTDREAEFDPDEIVITIVAPLPLEQLDLSITATPEETLTTFLEAINGKGEVLTDDSFDVPAARSHVTSSVIPSGSAVMYALAFEGGTILVAVLPGGSADETVLEILQSIQFSAVTQVLQAEGTRQWAARVSGSSQYGTNSWSFEQATGEPDTDSCGDLGTAWASQDSTGKAMLLMEFDEPVIPTQINIYQTFNPGSITRVDVGSSATSEWMKMLPNSVDAPGNTPCPGVFTVDIDGADMAVDLVRIYLDQSIGGSWNEIDAVELVGTPAE